MYVTHLDFDETTEGTLTDVVTPDALSETLLADGEASVPVTSNLGT